MNNIVVLNQVIIIFIIIVIGFISRKLKILNNDTNKGLTEFLLNITIPFTIISSFNQHYPKSVLNNAIKILLISFIIHSLSVVIGKLIFKKFEHNSKKVLIFVTIFSNCAFMGFPVMESIYGKIGIFYSSIYGIPFNIFVWTVGQMIFTGSKDKKTIKKAILNPGIAAVFLGLIIFLLPIELPIVTTKVIDMMGSLTTPLAMVLIGSMLASINIKEIFSEISAYYGSAVRLFFMPLLVLFILKSLGFTGIILGVCVISTAMPAAANTVIFSEKFGGNSILASKIVFISTAISVLTIPLILLLL